MGTAPQREPVNILVVDDRPAKLIAMEALLSDLDENVVCVASGADALRELPERDFAVILLDVNMPDMDGFETAALIRQRPRWQHVPIIFMTAASDDTHVLRGYSLGAVDYILSPIVPEILRPKVKVFVELFRMTAQLKRQAEERVALAEEQARRAAAEVAGRRAAFLAEAGKNMARSLDLETIAKATLDLAVPNLGDFAMLRLRLAGQELSHARHRREVAVTRELEAFLADGMGRAGRVLGRQLVTEAGGGEHAVRGVVCPLLARGTMVGIFAVMVEAPRATLSTRLTLARVRSIFPVVIRVVSRRSSTRRLSCRSWRVMMPRARSAVSPPTMSRTPIAELIAPRGFRSSCASMATNCSLRTSRSWISR